jgi:hypothetical protein
MQRTIIKPPSTRLDREKYTFCNMKPLEHLQIKKMARPKTNHTCYEKANPSRDTVPLMRTYPRRGHGPGG